MKGPVELRCLGGFDSLPAVGATDNEEVALMLLRAGTDISKMDDGGTQFRRYAVYKHWAGVIAWLDTHKHVVR